MDFDIFFFNSFDSAQHNCVEVSNVICGKITINLGVFSKNSSLYFQKFHHQKSCTNCLYTLENSRPNMHRNLAPCLVLTSLQGPT